MLFYMIHLLIRKYKHSKLAVSLELDCQVTTKVTYKRYGVSRFKTSSFVMVSLLKNEWLIQLFCCLLDYYSLKSSINQQLNYIFLKRNYPKSFKSCIICLIQVSFRQFFDIHHKYSSQLQIYWLQPLNKDVKVHADYIYLMQLQQSRPTPFFKGISLQDYMRDMDCPEEEDFINQPTDNLFLQCQPKSDLAHYAIKEIDQDNYDQSTDHQDLIIQPLHNYDLQRARIIPEDTKNKLAGHTFKIIDMRRTKHHSKSPLRDNPNTKKEMFRSLYGHNFAHQPKQQSGQLLSTLGISSWRGKHNSLNKKEVETRDKHRRQYQQLIRYESVVNQRLDTKLNSIRIDGVKDKIHERSEKFSKNR